MRPLPTPRTPGMLLAVLVILGIALLIAFGLGRGGFGMAQFLGGSILSVLHGALGLLRGGR